MSRIYAVDPQNENLINGVHVSPDAISVAVTMDMSIEYNNQFNTAVPEPSSLALLGIGIAGMAGYGWRRRKLAVA
jgi:hypothetical protein